MASLKKVEICTGKKDILAPLAAECFKDLRSCPVSHPEAWAGADCAVPLPAKRGLPWPAHSPLCVCVCVCVCVAQTPVPPNK
jgi:hypothetical protein